MFSSELDRNNALSYCLWSKCEACTPGHMVGGIIALGTRRLVSLGHCARDTWKCHICILKCFLIEEAGFFLPHR